MHWVRSLFNRQSENLSGPKLPALCLQEVLANRGDVAGAMKIAEFERGSCALASLSSEKALTCVDQDLSLSGLAVVSPSSDRPLWAQWERYDDAAGGR